MKHLVKAAVATVLLVGAGAANASIEKNAGGLNEAYLSAYDFTTGKTFSFDTGVTFNELVANESNAAYSLNFDFSADANWLNFITGATTSAIKYVVAVGNTGDLGAAITSNAQLTPNVENDLGIFFGFDVASAIEKHAIDLNTGLVVNSLLNESRLSLDTDSPLSGQHANADSVWGSWIQDPQANYGQAIGFQLGMLDNNTGANIASTFAGQWTLAGNSLTYAAATSAVPLPGAVWMFGAALMGMLGVSRRKAVAA
ncbi:MAG: hypothetical protein M0R33_06535 [Methylomonas sp.]|jgi:hypothetical protein|uniref:hypothetical protein n=1 Tax=Methylomonas sp. TaxID=418 RepID=UPI0025CBE9D1|nr:hypothetical protein [Methylomonas sp.]MCK9606094.1 hypothetical protein [Methylomonas sp.]